MKTETKIKIGMALFGMVGHCTTNIETMVSGALAGYAMAWCGCKLYNKLHTTKLHTPKVNTTKAKEMGADVLLGVMSVVAPNMTQYAKNLEYIKEGTKKPYKTSYYSKNDTYYYKDLADIFGVTQNEMLTILRKYIIKGKYPNVELRNNDWGEYKLTADGKRVYIEYNAECIEYLKVMLA